ncbi:MAG: hypothetical protein JWQ74_1366 [Marmoricola sp.]|nr:hypothetical protein [Marmoricola sp.]
MGRSRTDRSDLKRFGYAVVVSATLFLVLGLVDGEGVALRLQETPTTTDGWLFIGWLIGGPPYALAVLVWLERRRLSTRARQVWTIGLSLWIGLSLFILPARIVGVTEQYGTGALVGNPLSAGWVWGIFATGVVAFLAGIALFVVSLTAKDAAAARARVTSPRTRMLLERAWLLALLVSLGLALYGGNGSGIFNNGT